MFMQNMELDIPNNGSQRIPNYIMNGNVFSPNKINVTFQIYGLAAYASRKTTSHRIQGRPNLVHSVKEKMYINLKTLKATLKETQITTHLQG